MTNPRPFLCGNCRVQLEFSADLEGQMVGTCPICGQKDIIENIRREADDYIRYFFDKGMHDLLADTLSHSSVMHYHGDGPPEREFRFIVDME